MRRAMREADSARSDVRYRVGCAGMFMLGTDVEFGDLDAALIFAGGTAAAFVYGPRGEADECFGPFGMDEIEAARMRLEARNAA
jgi:hypothetical protein